MRRTAPRHIWALAGLMALFAPALLGAGASPKKRNDPPPPKVEETIGNLAVVYSKGEIKLEGIGLVFGLDNTGAEPPPSWYRSKLVEEMSKAGVENANRILKDKRFSLVIVH